MNVIITIYSSQKYPDGFKVSARIDKNNGENFAILELEDEYFLWDNPPIIQNETIYEKGQKGAIVELFGWPYDDISEECDFLRVAGYLGVKISPPNEHLFDDWYEDDGINPWKYFYQTVSYKLNYTRLGTKRQLKKMINNCRKKGLRIYSQVVLNQMTYNGNDVNQKHFNVNGCNSNGDWGKKWASCGSPFYTIKGRDKVNDYTGKKPIFEYPSVPYCGTDFRCMNNDKAIDEKWIDGSLADLDTGTTYVRQRIADFLTELISIGISGFSIFWAKYISTEDYYQIFKLFKENLGNSKLPDDFIVIFEMDTGNKELICNNDNNGNFGIKFKEKLKEIFSDEDVAKFKIQVEDSENKINNICNSNWIDEERYVMFLENHNNQNNDNKNIKNKINTKESHRAKYDAMFADPINSKIRILFSSYSLTNGATGFPDGYSSADGKQKSVKYTKAYDPLSIGYDIFDNGNWIEGNYTRVHRDLFIVNSMRTFIGLNNLTSDELYEYERYKVFGFPTTVPETILTTIITTIITTIPKNAITSEITTLTSSILSTSIKKVYPSTILTTIQYPSIFSTTLSKYNKSIIFFDSTIIYKSTNINNLIINIDSNSIDIINKTKDDNTTESHNTNICIPYKSINTDNEKLESNISFIEIKFKKFESLKCFKLVFSLDNIAKNIPSMLLLLYFLFYLIFFIIYIFQGIDPLIIYRIYEIYIIIQNIPHICHHKLKKNENKKIKEKVEKSKKIDKISNIIAPKTHICHHHNKIINNIDNKIISQDKNGPHICHHKIKKTYLKNNQNYINNNIIEDDEKIMNKKKISIFKMFNKNKKIKNPPKKQKLKIKEESEGSGISLIPKYKKKKKKLFKAYDENIDLETNKGSSSSSKNIAMSKEKEKIKKINNKNKLIKSQFRPKIGKLSDYELNHLEYKNAKSIDKRSFCRIYCSILSREEILIFIFCSYHDYNLLNLKLARFVFILYTNMAMNVLFFTEDCIQKIYLNNGKYEIKKQIPQIMYSFIATFVIEIFVCYLTLTDKDIYKVKKVLYNKNVKDDEILNIYKTIKIRLYIYFVISILFIIFYWYFVSSFCSIFVKVQLIIVINHIISKTIFLIYPFFLYFPCAIFRKISLNNKIECLYKLSTIIPIF